VRSHRHHPFTEPPVPLVLQEITLSAKKLRGALYGGMNPRTSVPMLLSLYQASALKLDELVTRHYRLDEINEAFADLREGRNIRGIIEFAGSWATQRFSGIRSGAGCPPAFRRAP